MIVLATAALQSELQSRVPCPRVLVLDESQRRCGEPAPARAIDLLVQENPLMYIGVYFRILHAYTIIYSIYLNIHVGFPIP